MNELILNFLPYFFTVAITIGIVGHTLEPQIRALQAETVSIRNDMPKKRATKKKKAAPKLKAA